jgi:hypothetical protein
MVPKGPVLKAWSPAGHYGETVEEVILEAGLHVLGGGPLKGILWYWVWTQGLVLALPLEPPPPSFEGDFLFVCFFVFWDRVSLCNPGWSQTHRPPASASQMLGVCHHARSTKGIFSRMSILLCFFVTWLWGGFPLSHTAAQAIEPMCHALKPPNLWGKLNLLSLLVDLPQKLVTVMEGDNTLFMNPVFSTDWDVHSVIIPTYKGGNRS